jgi:N-acetyl-gamma-glutamyl-phosphate reductase
VTTVTTKIQAAVLGATGYAGQELVRLLIQHPDVQLAAVSSQTYAGRKLTDVFPSLRGHVKLDCSENDLAAVAAESDVIFLALPHGAASKLVKDEHLAQARIIDLGGDFRFQKVETYEKWYGAAHGNAPLNSQSVYGLPEWNAPKIQTARLVANPGCYATAASLALLPLVKAGLIDAASIIVDAKSGVSGAGRAATQGVHFNECNETLKAYGLTNHKHTPEIEEQLQIFDPAATITFTPHLVPMNRGILATAYASLSQPASLMWTLRSSSIMRTRRLSGSLPPIALPKLVGSRAPISATSAARSMSARDASLLSRLWTIL